MRRLIVRAVLTVLAGAAPSVALAHGGAAQDAWNADPWIWLPLAALALLYLRGVLVLRARGAAIPSIRMAAVAGFTGGCTALFAALIWPLDAWSETSFAAHMAQHMLLIAVAAPLLAFARPAPVLLAALPSRARRVNARLGPLHLLLHALLRQAAGPGIAFVLHGFVVWVWHAPLLFGLALHWRWLHVLEHAAFFGSALLLWSAMGAIARRGGAGCGTAALLTLGTLIHTGLLGALLTFAPRLLYPVYDGVPALRLSAIEDQQLAGLLMWIPGSLAYLAAGLGFVAAWLRRPAAGTAP